MPASALILPAGLAGVAAGILAGDSVALVQAPILGGIVLAGIGVGLRWRTVLLIGVALTGLGLGSWRIQAADPVGASATSVATLVDGNDHEVLGTVVDDPRPREDRLQLVLGDLATARESTIHRLGDRLLVWLPRGVDAGAGDRMLVTSRIELAADFDGFAYREFLARQGIAAIARSDSAEVVGEASGPAAVLAGLRSVLLGGLNDLVPEPEAALGAGILLGVRSSIAPEINDAFATAGLTHVVAISGWNIAIVAALVAAAVRPLARRPGGRWTTAALAALTVGGYVVLTGASPSVVRAALMAAAMLVARLGGSRAHAASALALAALVMLLAAPPVVWDVGFQLSLLATAGLVWFGAAVERRLPRWPGWIREPVALTLAAQLTTLPVILMNFERLSLVAPIANVLVVPFVPIAMLFSALASVAGVLVGAVHVPLAGDALAWLAGGPAWLVLRAIVWLGTTVASVPHAAVDVRVPPALAVAWLPMLALASWAIREPAAAPAESMPEEAPGTLGRLLRRLARPLPVGAGLVAVLLAISIASRPDGLLHLTVLDIGQGDAILVEAPNGATMLIDGGPDPELTLRRIGANLPFFARRIDLLVLSHPHQDHVAGLVDVLDRFRVGAVLHAGIPFGNPAYDRLLADAARSGVRVAVLRTGQALDLGAGTTARVLYPTQADAEAPLPEGDINNGSIVLRLEFGGFAALLTGDAEAPIESLLASRGLLDAVDVLKVGHHGSNSSTTPRLVDAIHPSVAIISAGAGNEYGHPAPETLATLAVRPGIAVFRTDLQGDVEVVTDGTTLRVRTDAGWSPSIAVHRPPAAGDAAPAPRSLNEQSRCVPTIGRCWSARTAASRIPTASASVGSAELRWPRPPPRARSAGRSRSCSATCRVRRSSGRRSTRSPSAR